MNRLLFIAIALAGWMLFAVANRSLFSSQISAMPGQINVNNSNTSLVPQVRQNSGSSDELQGRIQAELYSAISTGMSYAEVSSILGWSGILIYENIVEHGEEAIQIAVYSWNYDDVYFDNTVTDEEINNSKIYRDRKLTVEFQNDIAVELDFSEPNLY